MIVPRSLQVTLTCMLLQTILALPGGNGLAEGYNFMKRIAAVPPTLYQTWKLTLDGKQYAVALDGQQPPPGTNVAGPKKDFVSMPFGECAVKEEPAWPKKQLSAESVKKCQAAKQAEPPKQRLKVGKRSSTSEVQLESGPVSADGKYSLGSRCSQSGRYLPHFLVGDDVKVGRTKICKSMLNWDNPEGKKLVAVDDEVYGSQNTNYRARRKIALTIWHTDVYKLIITHNYINHNLTTDAFNQAYDLCEQSMIYLGDTCNQGAFSTEKDPAQGKGFAFNAAKPGSVTWTNIKTGQAGITFQIGYKNCGYSGGDGNKC
ncbi:hypothetical protein EJ08DRAFT_695946 [Tothia fuscella]|uniref:Pectate lyase n=1 Tax=Tothia fuscella TaxID=1048955 RepID=A0A9P4TYV5_9PEZI|nr:hypothetical protein EJ08DRAFT_695946 [Tothia fuscella]